jgi:hypothetical protein
MAISTLGKKRKSPSKEKAAPTAALNFQSGSLDQAAINALR